MGGYRVQGAKSYKATRLGFVGGLGCVGFRGYI